MRVVVVDQFKAPTMDKGRDNGWIIELPAGTIQPNETPAVAAVRETLEETGYRIANPQPITTFFSSPGGTSERIFLFFADVRNADRVGAGGGKRSEGEDIDVAEITTEELFDGLKKGMIEDAKLVIGAYWLQERLKVRPQSSTDPLPLSTEEYTIKDRPNHVIGYKTGPIRDIQGVDVWVNSENTDMIMDRFIGRSISASIRFLGAEKNDDHEVVEDTIAEALRSRLGSRHHVRMGTVLETEAGALAATHRVKRIFHVATVKGVRAGEGVRAELSDLTHCTTNVLEHARVRNDKLWRTKYRSILLPMMGAGDGGLKADDVAPTIFAGAVDYFARHPKSVLEKIYLLAYTSGDKIACDRALEDLCRRGHLERAKPQGVADAV